jgi:nitric oxide reductase subunit B
VTDTKKLWKVLGGILLVSFGILLFMGRQIYLTMPPIPSEVRSASGATLFTKADIQTGQKVWQMIGGHQMGSVWGHGSYVAPDWTADWLHRESVALLDLWAVRETGRPYAELDPPQRPSPRSQTTSTGCSVTTRPCSRCASSMRSRRTRFPTPTGVRR